MGIDQRRRAEVDKGKQATNTNEERLPHRQGLALDIFEAPVTVTPPTGNFKNFKFFKNSLKIKNVYFLGEERLLLGMLNVYFGGNNVYFGGFGNFFFFLLGGFWDSVGRGAS